MGENVENRGERSPPRFNLGINRLGVFALNPFPPGDPVAAPVVGATLHCDCKLLMLKIGSQEVDATVLPGALNEEKCSCGVHRVSGFGLPNPTAPGTGLGS